MVISLYSLCALITTSSKFQSKYSEYSISIRDEQLVGIPSGPMSPVGFPREWE